MDHLVLQSARPALSMRRLVSGLVFALCALRSALGARRSVSAFRLALAA
jgi:hypothetical protein